MYKKLFTIVLILLLIISNVIPVFASYTGPSGYYWGSSVFNRGANLCLGVKNDGRGIYIVSDVDYTYYFVIKDMTSGLYLTSSLNIRLDANVPKLLYNGSLIVGRVYKEDYNGCDVTYVGAQVPPSAPTGLNSSVSGDSVILNWNANSSGENVTGYEIFINGTSQETVSGLTLTYTKNDLDLGNYSAYIRAINNSGFSEVSNTVNFSIGSTPSAPSGLTVSGSGGSGTLQWQSVSGAESYNIYDGSTLLQSGVTGLSHSFSGLGVGVHNLTVTSINVLGESGHSETVAYIVIGPPGQVTGVEVSGNGAKSGIITWSASPPEEEVTEYRLYESSDLIASPTTNSYPFYDYPTGYYMFQVSAVNAQGEGLKSDTIIYQVIPPPSVPELTSSAVTCNTVDLGWTDLGSGVTYGVYKGTTLENMILVASKGENVNYHHITGLNDNTTYYFKVVASNVNGSTDSNVINITTDLFVLPVPGVPEGFKVTPNPDGSVKLSWNANPSDQQVTSYKLYNNGSYLGSYTGTSATLTDLEGGGKYKFTLTAMNSSGESSSTAPLTYQASIMPKNVDFGFSLSDILAGIGLFLLQLWPLIALGIGITLAFVLARRTNILGRLTGKTEDINKVKSGKLRNYFGIGRKGEKRGYKNKNYFGRRKRKKGRRVLARRTTKKLIFGGSRLPRRSIKYGVKKVVNINEKRKKAQKKYGTFVLNHSIRKKGNYNTKPKKGGNQNYIRRISTYYGRKRAQANIRLYEQNRRV